MAKPKKDPTNHVSIGADPEFFVRRTDMGSPYPICGLLGGTKGKPIPVGPEGQYGMQEDNVMAEYNIPPSVESYSFSSHIRRGRQYIMEALESKFPGMYEIDLAPARVFPNAMLQSPQAMTFGCSPDFDSYQLGGSIPPIAPALLNTDDGIGAWRFCGGHVHLGYKHLLKSEVPDYVAGQFADVFLGVTMLGADRQGKRRQFYGTPGRYRPTSYGIEYRTLSNLWTSDENYTETIGHYALALCRFLCSPEATIKKAWAEIPWQDVKRAIANEDVVLASTLRNYVSSTLSLEL